MYHPATSPRLLIAKAAIWLPLGLFSRGEGSIVIDEAVLREAAVVVGSNDFAMVVNGAGAQISVSRDSLNSLRPAKTISGSETLAARRGRHSFRRGMV
jgi:hypothetical protein